MAKVAAASPPITARPSEAACPPLKAIGIMPAIIAALVIRIGRNRLRAPSMAASAELAPAVRLRSAKVTSKMAFATATPRLMIAPKGLNVECSVSQPQRQDDPGQNGGERRDNDEGQAQGLKIRHEQKENRNDREPQPAPQPIHHFLHRNDLPAHRDVDSRWRVA